MVTWTAIGQLCAFFALLGVAVDRFLLRRNKNALHLAMLSWWTRLDETTVPDLPKLAARWALAQGRKLFRWRLFSWQMIAASVVVSFLLTSIAWSLYYLLHPENVYVVGFPLPHVTLYIANWPSDFATIVVSICVLRIVLKHSVAVGILAICCDVIIGAALAIPTYSACVVAQEVAFVYSLPGTQGWKEQRTRLNRHYMEGYIFTEDFEDFISTKGFTDKASIYWVPEKPMKYYALSGFKAFRANVLEVTDEIPETLRAEISEGPNHKVFTIEGGRRATFAYWFVPGSTFVPTALLMLLLLILALAKLVLTISRFISLHVLELITESDPSRDPKQFMPFTLLGVVFGVVAALAKLICELIPLAA